MKRDFWLGSAVVFMMAAMVAIAAYGVWWVQDYRALEKKWVENVWPRTQFLLAQNYCVSDSRLFWPGTNIVSGDTTYITMLSSLSYDSIRVSIRD